MCLECATSCDKGRVWLHLSLSNIYRMEWNEVNAEVEEIIFLASS